MFNLFKRKKDKQKIDYSLLTLRKFNTILDIAKKAEPTSNLQIMRELYGEEKGDITFLMYDKIPYKKYSKTYTINKKKYILCADITKFTTSQYIDYSNGKEIIDFLKVILVPDGHTYNDGYDMNEVREDLLDMKMVDVNAVLVFLVRQFQTFVLLIRDYLKKEMPEKLSKIQMITPAQMETISLSSTELSTIVTVYAKNLI